MIQNWVSCEEGKGKPTASAHKHLQSHFISFIHNSSSSRGDRRVNYIYTPWIDSGQQKGHTAKQAVSWIERILVPRPIQIAVSNLFIIPWLNEEWESPLKGETIVSTMS